MGQQWANASNDLKSFGALMSFCLPHPSASFCLYTYGILWTL